MIHITLLHKKRVSTLNGNSNSKKITLHIRWVFRRLKHSKNHSNTKNQPKQKQRQPFTRNRLQTVRNVFRYCNYSILLRDSWSTNTPDFSNCKNNKIHQDQKEKGTFNAHQSVRNFAFGIGIGHDAKSLDTIVSNTFYGVSYLYYTQPNDILIMFFF